MVVIVGISQIREHWKIVEARWNVESSAALDILIIIFVQFFIVIQIS